MGVGQFRRSIIDLATAELATQGMLKMGLDNAGEKAGQHVRACVSVDVRYFWNLQKSGEQCFVVGTTRDKRWTAVGWERGPVIGRGSKGGMQLSRVFRAARREPEISRAKL